MGPTAAATVNPTTRPRIARPALASMWALLFEPSRVPEAGNHSALSARRGRWLVVDPAPASGARPTAGRPSWGRPAAGVARRASDRTSGGTIWAAGRSGQARVIRPSPLSGIVWRTMISSMPPSDAPILVVDDDQKIVALVKTYLERERYRVVTAGDGLAALRAIEESEPRLVVLDLMLPELDGLAVIRRARARGETP